MDDNITAVTTSDASSSSSFLPRAQTIGMIRWKSGKKVDPRLFLLLQYFRELYMERREFFKKIFPGIYDEFVDVFKKVGAVLKKDDEVVRGGIITMQRSLSLGSELRLDRFKVKTPDLGGVPPSGQGGQSSQGATKSNVSK